jgi:hypothetical protein
MLKPKQPATPALSLDERIAAIHAEIDALIDAKAAELKKQYYDGVFSVEALAHGIKVKAWGCPCKQYQALKDEG